MTKKAMATTLLVLGVLALPLVAQAQGTLFVKGNKVGIGESDPIQPLHIKADAGSNVLDFILMETGGSTQPQTKYIGSAGTWRIGMNGAGDFVMNELADLTPAELKVTKAGNVWVNGTQVHPDYVFESDYDLMPLDELERFIMENKHLPNVMSSEQRAQQGGIDLSAFPLQVLEKVEELTLYTIDQQRHIDELTAQNSMLKERLAALESAVGVGSN